MKHDVCLRQKTTGTVCSTGATPVTAITVPETDAKFFQQVWTVSNTDKADYDTVEWAQEWSVVGDCNATTNITKCNMFNKTFGQNAAAGSLNEFYVTRSSISEGWKLA